MIIQLSSLFFQMAGLILIFVAWMPILGFPRHIVGSIPTSGLEHGVYPNSNYCTMGKMLL